jgi:hypothetical protein
LVPNRRLPYLFWEGNRKDRKKENYQAEVSFVGQIAADGPEAAHERSTLENHRAWGTNGTQTVRVMLG